MLGRKRYMRKLEFSPKPEHLAAEVPINILHVVPPDPNDLSRYVGLVGHLPIQSCGLCRK